MPSASSLPTAGTRQRLGMPSAGCLPSAVPWALGKGTLCRVPVFGHSAKPEALGNYEFSGSAYYIFFSLINGVIMVCWYEVGERD